MLQSFSIRNLALIESLDLTFERDLTMITGETGAGKSVMTGAIALLLGGRFEKNMIRQGAQKCELEGVFLLNPLPDVLRERCVELEIPWDDDEKTLHIRRVFTAASTRNFINDCTVTAQTLQQFGGEILDLHAANEHNSLSSNRIQLHLLDRFAGLDAERRQLRNAYAAITEAESACAAFESQLPKQSEYTYFKEACDEIARIAPEPDEDTVLNESFRRASHSRELGELAAAAVGTFESEEAGLDAALRQLRRCFDRMAHLDESAVQMLLEKLSTVQSLSDELQNDLSRYAGSLEWDEEALQNLSLRLEAVQKLKRRYGPDLNQVFEFAENAQAQIQLFENAEAERVQLEEAAKAAKAAYKQLAERVHAKRVKVAAELSSAVERQIRALGFLQAVFSISFTACPPGPEGTDRIEFMFSGNPGEAPEPLKSIASSGEISRIMLAIKAVLAEADDVPVLVFDEIDVNIGGETANIVGQTLRRLSQKHQLICISHLPQVAVCGTHHFRVQKAAHAGRTLTEVIPLEGESRIAEIARMLGGGAPAEAHARALLHL